MATFSERIDTLRARPRHEQRRVAFLVSFVVTGVVALGWAGALTTSNRLSVALPSDTPAPKLTETKTNFDQLLGAAGAALGASSSPARITVVEGATYSTLDHGPANMNATSKTVITF